MPYILFIFSWIFCAPNTIVLNACKSWEGKTQLSRKGKVTKGASIEQYVVHTWITKDSCWTLCWSCIWCTLSILRGNITNSFSRASVWWSRKYRKFQLYWWETFLCFCKCKRITIRPFWLESGVLSRSGLLSTFPRLLKFSIHLRIVVCTRSDSRYQVAMFVQTVVIYFVRTSRFPIELFFQRQKEKISIFLSDVW